MKKNKIIICLILGVYLGIFITVFLSSTTSNAKKTITSKVSGTIEVKEVNILSKLPGRVDKLLVQENQTVKAGETIAILSSDELKAKEIQAKALVEAAKTQLEQANNSVILQEAIAKSNSDKANAALAAAQSQYNKARNGARKQEINEAQIYYDTLKTTYARVKFLAEKGAVTQQKADEVKAQMDIAKATLDMAKEGARPEDIEAAASLVSQAKAAVDAANTGNLQVELAKQNVEAAKAKYEQALGGLQEVQAYLKDTKIISPIDGTVTMINAKKGELVATGYTVAMVSDLSDMWVNVKLKETDISKVNLNQRINVTLSAYPDNKFEGKIADISKKPDFAAKRSTNERDEEDIVAYNVKVKIANKNGILRPGLTASVGL